MSAVSLWSVSLPDADENLFVSADVRLNDTDSCCVTAHQPLKDAAVSLMSVFEKQNRDQTLKSKVTPGLCLDSGELTDNILVILTLKKTLSQKSNESWDMLLSIRKQEFGLRLFSSISITSSPRN